jgi:hypothetical protein
VNAAALPVDVREWVLSMPEFYGLRRLAYRYLRAKSRAGGRKGRRRPRDATAGVSCFLNWWEATRLAGSQVADVQPLRLVRESMALEEDMRFMRSLMAEQRRQAREASSEGGREEAPSKRRRSRTAARGELRVG